MLDSMIRAADNALRTLVAAVPASRPCPQPPSDKHGTSLNAEQKAQSGALMRVNHVGEVCAQAMYQAQSLTTRSPELRARLERSAREEADHLAWTRQRMEQLGARPSLLNPLWYAGAFSFGLLAGRVSDATSLGFIVETERQVEQHLHGHLERLPENDDASRAIVEQMKADEMHHAEVASSAGARSMPAPVRLLMRGAAKIMTATAHYI